MSCDKFIQQAYQINKFHFSPQITKHHARHNLMLIIFLLHKHTRHHKSSQLYMMCISIQKNIKGKESVMINLISKSNIPKLTQKPHNIFSSFSWQPYHTQYKNIVIVINLYKSKTVVITTLIFVWPAWVSPVS